MTMIFTTIYAALALAQTAPGGHQIQYDIRVDGITCPFCFATSKDALEMIEGVSRVVGDLETGTISVCADESVVLTDDELRDLFRSKGFTFRTATRSQTCTIDEPASE
tara:strand:+ start:51773 stop:52096 length:324 start_codon:yes stop_codon:yes gene_type:complete